jgi:hypothetical protein
VGAPVHHALLACGSARSEVLEHSGGDVAGVVAGVLRRLGHIEVGGVGGAADLAAAGGGGGPGGLQGRVQEKTLCCPSESSEAGLLAGRWMWFGCHSQMY